MRAITWKREMALFFWRNEMRTEEPVSPAPSTAHAATVTRRDEGRRDPADDVAGDRRRSEARVDDDRTPEEEGYGYGV